MAAKAFENRTKVSGQHNTTSLHRFIIKKCNKKYIFSWHYSLVFTIQKLDKWVRFSKCHLKTGPFENRTIINSYIILKNGGLVILRTSVPLSNGLQQLGSNYRTSPVFKSSQKVVTDIDYWTIQKLNWLTKHDHFI